MIRKVHAVIGVLLLASLVAAACAPAQAPTPTPTKAAVQETKPAAAAPTKAPEPTKPPAPTPTPKPVTVKYGSPGGMNSEAGVFVALEKGYFKEQGITPEFTPAQTGTGIIPALATGELDVGITALSLAVLAAADRGLDLTIGAGVEEFRPGWESAWIVLRKDLADSGKVKTAADLKGMKVAIHAVAHPSELTMQMFLEQGGVKPGEVEVVVIGSADQLAAFANKAIAASTSTAVIVATGVQQGLFTKWVPFAKSFGGTLQGSIMVYSPAFAKDQDRGRRWMIAYLKGVRDYMKAFTTGEGRQEVVNILTKHTGIKDPKQYDVIGMSYLLSNGGLHMESVDMLEKLWREKGQYTGKKRFRDLVDLSHADYAVQKLGN